MKSSRKEGLLVLKINKPYELANKSGTVDQYTTVICREIDSKTESIAYDLEQHLSVALMNLGNNIQGQNQNNVDNDEDAANEFYENNSPSQKDISTQAKTMLMLINMNQAVKMSEIMKTFVLLVEAGLVLAEGEIKMSKQIWDQIHRDDKLLIMGAYISFFANPLQKLSGMAM